ncbi:MAG: acyltransferase [Solirubrobacterales bacterium]|nr:acyltransferase [Solirubrobacterales bacterium]
MTDALRQVTHAGSGTLGAALRHAPLTRSRLLEHSGATITPVDRPQERCPPATPPRNRPRRSIALVASASAIIEPVPAVAPQVRGEPAPLHGGPLALWRFMRDHGMLTRSYAELIARWLWLKLRFRGRLKTDGLCFVCPGVTIEIGKGATLHLGRWSWIGHGSKIRVHEGEARIGAKSVLGQECTISAFQHVSIGRECIIADRVMLIDFDHGVVEVERPVRAQGIYKRDVRVGHNVWIGYGVAILRGVTVGDNSVLGTSTIVSKDVPANAVAAGVPVRVIRMRKAPQVMRWE